MPEQFRHDRYVRTGGEPPRRDAVAEVVKPDPPDTGLFAHLTEPLGDLIGVQRRAILRCEHEPVIAVSVAQLGAVGVLAEPVFEQGADRNRVQLDHTISAAARLRLAEVQTIVAGGAVCAVVVASELDELLADADDATLKISSHNRLVDDGETVLDVPAKLSAQVRVFATGNGRKTDPVDAYSVTIAALRASSLMALQADPQLVVLGMLADRRDELGRDRTQLVTRLHRLLLELIPGGANQFLSARRPAPWSRPSGRATWWVRPAAGSPSN